MKQMKFTEMKEAKFNERKNYVLSKKNHFYKAFLVKCIKSWFNLNVEDLKAGYYYFGDESIDGSFIRVYNNNKNYINLDLYIKYQF